MEVDTVVEIIVRYEYLYGLKCANYIDDGDSKTFRAIIINKRYEYFEVHKSVFIMNKKECALD